MASSVVGLRRNSKALPKAKLAPLKKVMVTVWWYPACLTHEAFWILVKPLHLRIKFSKSMRCTKNYNAYSRYWSTERAQFFSTTTCNYTTHKCFRSWTNWATKFCLIHRIHLTFCQPTTTSLSILMTSCKEMLPRPGGRDCFPRVHRIPKNGFLCYRNKHVYFSLTKMC